MANWKFINSVYIKIMKQPLHLISVLLLSILLVGCAQKNVNGCPVSEPLWIKPPEDSAVNNPPVDGYYFVNQDQSILASAWWTGQEENYLTASENGVKMGWFRPAGIELQITGQRIDAEAPPLEAHVPCCYPTRFQATGINFPTEGCWEVTAKAEDSVLSFVVWVEP